VQAGRLAVKRDVLGILAFYPVLRI
jgi:hypothetical protein